MLSEVWETITRLATTDFAPPEPKSLAIVVNKTGFAAITALNDMTKLPVQVRPCTLRA